MLKKGGKLEKCECSYEPKKGDRHCRNCGNEITPLSDSFLCECGAEVDQNDSFCHACGVKFDGIEEEEEFLNNSNCTTCGGPY